MDGRSGAAPFSPAQLDVGSDCCCCYSNTRLAISVGIVQVARGYEHTLVLKGE